MRDVEGLSGDTDKRDAEEIKEEWKQLFIREHAQTPDPMWDDATDTWRSEHAKILKVKKDPSWRSEARLGIASREKDRSNLDASIGTEHTRSVKASEPNQRFKDYFKYKSTKKAEATKAA